jgi:hypothetical protein
MIADDDSTDNSWDVIKSFDRQLEYKVRRADKISDTDYTPRVFSRQHLLDEVRRRFGTKDVWVQIIESDTALLDTDVREVISKYAVDDISVRWHMINACRRVWTPEYDVPRIPAGMPLHEYFDAAHWMEQISSYTFRPLPELHYTERFVPWPRGWSHYLKSDPPWKLVKHDDSPLIVHYGYRSPTFYSEKIGPSGGTPKKNVRSTVPFFNGAYNNHPVDTFSPISREGWKAWLKAREEDK